MHFSKDHQLVRFALLLLGASACTDQAIAPTTPLAAAPRSELATPATPPTSIVTSDDQLARIAREDLPGFGGWYIDQGEVFLQMKAGQDTTHARARANGLIDALVSRGRSHHVTRIKAASFDFAELKAWHDRITAELDNPAVTMTSIDVVTNRIYVGIKPDVPLGPVRAELARIGIPPAAIEVAHHAMIDYKPYVCVDGDPTCIPREPREPPDSTNTDFYVGTGGTGTGLQAYYRPLVGGLLIRYHDNSMNWYSCTLGANAVRYGTVGFLTASHCAIREGVPSDGTQYTQGGDFYVIGTSRVEPPYSISCNGGRIMCRYSDATFVQNNGWAYASARLAEPFFKTNIGDPLAVANYQGYTVRAARRVPAAMLMVGQTVNKVGAFTGFSSGRVEKTCVYAYGATSGLICQVLVRGARAQSGDSGAPVFSDWLSATSVVLEGLLAGGDKNDPTVYLFSPWGAIEAELGQNNLVVW